MTVRAVAVIPCHANVATVAEVARRCLDHLPDVVVVDDGSTDGSGDAARAVPGVTVLVHPVNRGKGAALDTALRWARDHGFTHILALDADGQHLPEDLPVFLEAVRRDPWAIHAGVRDLSTAPGSSQFGRRFSNFWIWADTGHRVADSQCGFRAYPVEPVLALGLRPGRYEWEVKVLVRALWSGLPVRDLPCRVFYPPTEARVSSFRPFKDNFRISVLNALLFNQRLWWPPRWFVRLPAPGEGADQPWQGRSLGRLWGWRFYLAMIRLFGRFPTYLPMTWMAFFYLLVSGSHRRGVDAYLRRLDPTLSAPARLWRAWRIFLSFACSLVDRFALLVRGPGDFHIEHENADPAKEALRRGGLLLLTSHLGNADLGGTALQANEGRRPVHIVQYTSPRDPYVALVRRYLGEEHAPRIISLNQGADHASLEAVRALRRGDVVAMKGDRAVDARCARVPLLGGTLSLPTGPYLLAAISGVPLVVMGCFKEGPSTYRVVCTEPRILSFTSRKDREADLARWAAEYAAVLEGWIRRYPGQWYNFFDPWEKDGG